jgi:hypothetical protein
MLDRMWPFRRDPSHRIRSSNPYWLLRSGMGDARPTLHEAIDCDVAIIGAGITGTLVADALVATGQRIVILDSRDVALGSTAASTALLQYEIDTHLTELVAQLGAAAAAQAYLACAASFEMFEQRFPELLATSNYRRVPSLYLASDARAVPTLQAELAARRAIGFQCAWLSEAELAERHGCRDRAGSCRHSVPRWIRCASRRDWWPGWNVTGSGCLRAAGSLASSSGVRACASRSTGARASTPRTWWLPPVSNRWISCRSPWSGSTIPTRW